MCYYQAKQYGAALDAFQRAVDLNSTAGGWFNLGATAEHLALHTKAEAAYRTALNQRPDWLPPLLGLVRVMTRANRLEPLLSLISHFPEKDASSELQLAHFNLLHRLQRPIEAMAIFDKLHQTSTTPLPTASPDLLRLHRLLWSALASYDQSFGGGGFYQSFEPLLIPGMRPTQKRIDAYRLHSFASASSTVLDIGCNHGFMSLAIAPYVSNVVGCEIDAELIKTATLTQDFLGCRNVEFVQASALSVPGSYDLVLSCAVHQWIGLPFSQFGQWIRTKVRPGGYLVFESNDLSRFDSNFDEKVSTLLSSGFTSVHACANYDDAVFKRKAVILRHNG